MLARLREPKCHRQVVECAGLTALFNQTRDGPGNLRLIVRRPGFNAPGRSVIELRGLPLSDFQWILPVRKCVSAVSDSHALKTTLATYTLGDTRDVREALSLRHEFSAHR